MSLDLAALRAHGALSDLDVSFATTIARLAGERRPAVLLAAALASRRVASGHVCVDLHDVAKKQALRTDDGTDVIVHELPDARAWLDLVASSPLVGDDAHKAPLVLDDQGRLYLRRYWEYERNLAAALLRRIALPDLPVDAAVLRRGLGRLFPQRDDAPDLQRLAAVLASLRRFCIVSGGPGTGKTSTVVKILALLVEQAAAAGTTPPRVHLLAPTGKAAARLNESIRAAKAQLDVDDAVRAAIPEEAATIHRALGRTRASATAFRHDAKNPLATDVVLVDEASMVDLALMARLVQAVPDGARLILLGDKDQLASVESGAVLGDLCGGARRPPWSRALRETVLRVAGDAMGDDEGAPALPGPQDGIVELTKNWRFGDDSPIGALAAAINAADDDTAIAVLNAGASVRRADPLPERGLGEPLRSDVVRGFRAAVGATEAHAALAALNGYRVLCAHRRGARGVDAVNEAVRRALVLEGLVASSGAHYAGRPILVTENDYQHGLFNGDVGILLRTPEGALRACFAGPEGAVRSFSTGWLPPHETVFATSVHKSQGSEFDRVAVVLPTEASPVLTRELLYTAVTRAKHEVVVFASEAAIRAAVRTPIERASGLRDLLWGATSSSRVATRAPAGPPPAMARPVQMTLLGLGLPDAVDGGGPKKRAGKKRPVG